MHRPLLVVMFLCLAVPGCMGLGPGRAECGVQVQPRAPGTDETVSLIDDEFLADHPTLQKVFGKPEVGGGTGSLAPCDEAVRTMSALRELGGTSRSWNEFAHETLVSYAGQTYAVSTAKGVQ